MVLSGKPFILDISAAITFSIPTFPIVGGSLFSQTPSAGSANSSVLQMSCTVSKLCDRFIPMIFMSMV
jgi:hypothetical protein